MALEGHSLSFGIANNILESAFSLWNIPFNFSENKVVGFMVINILKNMRSLQPS